MTTTMNFVCSICEEQSTRICVKCTKDTCSNHLCEKCGACSDCCDCDLRLEVDSSEHALDIKLDVRTPIPHEPDEPKPHPMPDPDPAPDPEPVPGLDS
jgi:transcription elongation factor Elf1